MKATLAFILDQILQFWPPYRQEPHEEIDLQADQRASRESRQKRRSADSDSVCERDDSRQRLAR
jgi:hypothetical protein